MRFFLAFPPSNLPIFPISDLPTFPPSELATFPPSYLPTSDLESVFSPRNVKDLKKFQQKCARRAIFFWMVEGLRKNCGRYKNSQTKYTPLFDCANLQFPSTLYWNWMVNGVGICGKVCKDITT